MTTAIEVIDSAIKIGLGAIIGGGFSLLLTAINNKNQRSVNKSEEQLELLKQITLNLEKVETLNTESFMHFHNQCPDESRKLNIEALDAARVVSAYANILASDDLVSIAQEIIDNLECTYKELRSEKCSEKSLYDLEVKLENLKKLAYPHVRSIYVQVSS